METFLNSLLETVRPLTREGQVASYIPELKKADPSDIAVAVIDKYHQVQTAGVAQKRFTIQSISKIVSLIYALEAYGEEEVFNHIGMEQTADPFNSIIKLETKSHKPLNPLINAGAIATVGVIVKHEGAEAFSKLHRFTQELASDFAITLNQEVFQSELETGDINRSLAYFQKGKGNITADVDQVLEVYFKMCSLDVTCENLAHIGLTLALNGKSGNGQLYSRRTAWITKAIMTTCGMYDGSGRFAVEVGLPAKSGVGGGILTLVPGQMGIATYGPSLDEKGNSIAGMEILKRLSQNYDLSMF